MFRDLVIHKLEANAGSFEIQDDGYQSEFNYKLDCFGSNEPRNDGPIFPSLEGSANELRAKQRREGGGVAVPLYASEQDRGSKGVGESKPSPQPSPIGEGAFRHSEALIFKKLKQISNNTVWRVERHAPERIQLMMADRGQEVRRSGDLEGKKIGRYEGKLLSVNSLSSNPPTLLSSNNHSGGNAMLIPPYELSSDKPLTLTRKGRGQCASPFTLHHYLKRNAAFTLAEVLITLGIIGIVAALTMPALIANYQKKQTVVQLKKVYSVLNQAVARSIVDNGEVESWNWQLISDDAYNTKQFVETYLTPYLNNIKIINSYTNVYKDWKSFDGTKFTTNYMEAYALSDGTILGFNNRTSDNPLFFYIRIYVDLNGQRGPNRIGRDIFVFSLFKNVLNGSNQISSTTVMPGSNEDCGNGVAHYIMDRDTLTTSGCNTCKIDHTGYGVACAALIMKDGWEIKDDYPW